jgi:hypothetical protein
MPFDGSLVQTITIPSSGFPNGMLFYNVVFDNAKFTGKLVKE